mgnify:CR=1 FL=1
MRVIVGQQDIQFGANGLQDLSIYYNRHRLHFTRKLLFQFCDKVPDQHSQFLQLHVEDAAHGLLPYRRLQLRRTLLQAACAMELWRKADFEGERIVIDALVRRRSAEKTLFLTPTHGWVPAPSELIGRTVHPDGTETLRLRVTPPEPTSLRQFVRLHISTR